MNRQLTVTSAAEYNRVLYGQMSPAMAVAYLQDNQLPVLLSAMSFIKCIQEMICRHD